MTMKKKLLTTLSVVLILGLAALGILAYLTDTDSDVNVMTMGEVDIEQTEYQLDGNNNLIPFEQNKPLYPNTSIDKIVKVENVGESNAYVRTWFAFEAPVEGVIEPAWAAGIAAKPYNGGAITTIDGKEYVIYVVTYDEALDTNEVVTSLEKVKMAATATNADVAKYGDTYEVLVFSQAVQTAGFNDASSAFAAAFGDGHPWNIARTTEEAQAALDNAQAGDVIQLYPGVDYGTLYLRATETNVTGVTCFPNVCGYTTSDVNEFKAHWANENTGGGGHHPCYTAAIKNVTIVGADGATVAGVQVFSGHASAGTTDAVLGDANTGSYYVALNISNLTFKDVAFTGKVNIESSHEDAVYDGVTFNGCSFTTGGITSDKGAAIRYYSEANNGKVKNIVVKDCAFNNCRQGVYTNHVNGVTVTGSTFDTLGHNAIAVQSHSSAAHGNVTIIDNTFKNVANRVIRFNGVDAPTAITIQNNTATNCGDDANEIMKATSIADGVTTNISGNNWGAGKIVANDELKDK